MDSSAMIQQKRKQERPISSLGLIGVTECHGIYCTCVLHQSQEKWQMATTKEEE